MQYVPPMSSVRGVQNAVFRVDRASFHSSSAAMGKVKTKKAAAKRFLKTGKGDLKYGKAGKRHLNKHKSRTRVRRLGEKGILEGVWAKKMKILLPY
jgi:large subunit ribosomal protein L35